MEICISPIWCSSLLYPISFSARVYASINNHTSFTHFSISYYPNSLSSSSFFPHYSWYTNISTISPPPPINFTHFPFHISKTPFFFFASFHRPFLDFFNFIFWTKKKKMFCFGVTYWSYWLAIGPMDGELEGSGFVHLQYSLVLVSKLPYTDCTR